MRLGRRVSEIRRLKRLDLNVRFSAFYWTFYCALNTKYCFLTCKVEMLGWYFQSEVLLCMPHLYINEIFIIFSWLPNSKLAVGNIRALWASSKNLGRLRPSSRSGSPHPQANCCEQSSAILRNFHESLRSWPINRRMSWHKLPKKIWWVIQHISI